MESYKEFIGLFDVYVNVAKKFKNIILYGWNWENGGGTYLEWIMKHYYNLFFDYIIDDVETSYGKKIYRYNLLEYVDCENTLILATKDVSVLEKHGYVLNVNLFDLRGDLAINNIGYYEWIEKNNEVDVIERFTKINIEDVCVDGKTYAASRGIGIAIVCEYLSQKYPTGKVLDIGCGKGAAMIMFNSFGYNAVDGLEYLEDLACCARQNLKKMNMKSIIFQEDATQFERYSEYDIFYLYDPFRGETFRKVISKIEDSYKKKKRRIILVYANPWENYIVQEYSSFKLENQLDGDWFTRMANVYILE